MPSIISGLLRKATRKEEDKLNILTFNVHERQQTAQCLTGHNFYAFGANNVKDWNLNYAPIPINYTILNRTLGPNQIPLDIDFDLVISQNEFVHYPIAKDISQNLNIPLIKVSHVVPSEHWNPTAIKQAREMSGDIDIFISEYSIKAWGIDRKDKHKVIMHGVDTETFKYTEQDRTIDILNVCNAMQTRPLEVGWNEWLRANELFPNKCKLVGDNPPYTTAPKTIDLLVREYQNAKIFLNTTLVSVYPTSLIESMACGCVPVAANNCALPEVITHGYDGFLYNTEEEMVKYVNDLLNDEDMRKELSCNALKTIKTKFSMERFITQWNEVLYEAANL